MSRLYTLIAIMVVVIALFIFSRISANSPEKQVEKLAYPAPSALDEATNQLLRMGERSVPALIKAVDENKNPNVRFRAARILGLFGPVSKDAVPILIKNLKDDDVELRCNIVEALGLIGPEPGVIPYPIGSSKARLPALVIISIFGVFAVSSSVFPPRSLGKPPNPSIMMYTILESFLWIKGCKIS